MDTKGLKKVVRSFSGLVLVAFIAAAAVTYFTDKLSVSDFTTIAFVIGVAALALTYFGWLTMRAGIIYVVLAIVLLSGIAYGKHPAVKGGQFQAVFLTSGQVYFGHLKNSDSKDPTLTDVYYLHSTQQNSTTGASTTSASSTAGAASAQGNVTLVKLGNEVHGPEDQITLKPAQILYWENLKSTSKVVQAISKNEQKK